MRFKKFKGQTLAEAVALVKKELGPHALIISTKDISRGAKACVEVTAAEETDHGTGEIGPASGAGDVEAGGVAVGSGSRGPSGGASMVQSRITNDDIERFVAPLRSELRALRTVLRAEADPTASEVRRELAVLRDMVSRMSSGEDEDGPHVENLRHLASKCEIATLENARVTALVGPTGAGKTTTIAKLAARAALMEGERVALVSLDAYRVGGEQQIRIFADLIGIPVVMARTPKEAKSAIASLSSYDRIFVDTAGRSPRDTVAISDTVLGLLELPEVEIHLAMAAGTRGASMDRWMGLYPENAVKRLLFTKIDEADDLGELVRAPVRLGRPIRYIANGQRVPEDLEDATRERLLYLATHGMAAKEEAA
ncbi:MAG: hypothetical protein IPK13_22405 [Deltaproteobacteria bacterium]|nr:hypothetical protein [Deltaproteobacteria bacterium]